ncbi:MAG: NAD-dependent epimerase/dehydratase family protein [Anaerovoracaceae bacterium]
MRNVLVTGGTGFLAGWTIRKLLEQGCDVKTTVRSENKESQVTIMLQHEGVDTSRLSFAIADLTKSDGWDDAMEGIDYVLHVASPLGGNNHEDPSLIPIAKNGVENVIGAAIRAGVKKVVMTSSEAANYPDKKDPNPAVNEDFWTDMNNKWITNYQRSKVIAEKTAWEMIENQSVTKLATILPGAILGPYMDGKRSSTDQIFEMLLKGTPSPNVVYPVGDVRDLAELHILAMNSDNADGQRFIAESDEMTMPEMARLLKKTYPDKNISTMVIPDFVISIMAKFHVPMKVLNTMIGLEYHRDNSKARRLLGWNPRPARETVLDTANYLIKNSNV